MKAFLDNRTGLPKVAMRQAVRWVLRELGVDLPTIAVKVDVTQQPTHHGTFYPHARLFPRVWRRLPTQVPIATRHLIVGKVPLIPTGVHDRKLRGGPPSIDPQTWIESVVCIVAHEATHARQFLFPIVGRPKFSEVEAEWSEFRLLKRWRERSK